MGCHFLEDAPNHAKAGRGFHPQVLLYGLLLPTWPVTDVNDASDLPFVRVTDFLLSLGLISLLPQVSVLSILG